MAAHNFKDLLRHYGHEIVCVAYAKQAGPGGLAHDRTQRAFAENMSLECETCGEVLLNFDRQPKDQPPKDAIEIEKLIKEWEALATKYAKQAGDIDYKVNDLLTEKLYAMAEVYSYCADCLRRLK